MANRITIALATGTMPVRGWRDALASAFADPGFDVDLRIFEGSPLGARYAIVWLPPAELFAAEPGLRVVFNLGAGVDALLACGLVPPHLPILRLVDAGMAPKIAEYVCFALARITRGLERFAPPPRGRRDWNASRPRGAAPLVGVMGLGAIGRPILEAAARFGYPVAGWSRSGHSLAGIRTYAGAEEFGDFLAATQVLVNALPLTPQTENLLDARAFARLPHGAHVINVGRGATIVDQALLEALDRGHLAGATLDVFRCEPLPDGHPFWEHPSITVTPHLSGPTPHGPAAAQIVAALARLERGEPASTLAGYVDRTLGY